MRQLHESSPCHLKQTAVGRIRNCLLLHRRVNNYALEFGLIANTASGWRRSIIESRRLRKKSGVLIGDHSETPRIFIRSIFVSGSSPTCQLTVSPSLARPHEFMQARLSRLNHTASVPAAYASSSALPHSHAKLASGWWLAFTGRVSNPLDSDEWFPSHGLPPFPGLPWRYQIRSATPYFVSRVPMQKRTYQQLQPEERMTIASMSQQGPSVRAKARTLGRSAATVSRELARNTCPMCRLGVGVGARAQYKPSPSGAPACQAACAKRCLARSPDAAGLEMLTPADLGYPEAYVA